MGDDWAPRDVHDEPIEERFAGRIPQHVRPELQKISRLSQSWVGHLAIGWSLDHYFAFHGHPRGPHDYPWVLTCYEKLFTDGVRELTRIVNAFDGVVSDRMRSRMGQASSFAAEDFLQDEEHQLTKWRTELSKKEVDTILKVVAAFDLDFYTNKPAPDYHELYQFQRPSLSSIGS